MAKLPLKNHVQDIYRSCYHTVTVILLRMPFWAEGKWPEPHDVNFS